MLKRMFTPKPGKQAAIFNCSFITETSVYRKNDNDIFTRLSAKLEHGERLDFADALALYQCDDILRLGQLAEYGRN